MSRNGPKAGKGISAVMTTIDWRRFPYLGSLLQGLYQRFRRHSGANWQRFTYLGARSLASDDPDPTGSALKAGSLAAAQPGDYLRIVALHCGDSNRRLRGMGLNPGCELEVINCTLSGSVIVSLGDRQLGFAPEIASRIYVEPALSPTSHRPQPQENAAMPTTQISLSTAAIGTCLRVVGYAPAARTYKHKLLAMGLTPGTEFTITRHAPLGDPTEITVRGYQLSLRKGEAEALQVAVVPSGESDA